MTKKTSPKKTVQKKEVSGAAITVLAVMGIVGLILLAVGVYSIFEGISFCWRNPFGSGLPNIHNIYYNRKKVKASLKN